MSVKRRVARDGAGEAGSGFVKGLSDLIEKLGDLAETGREMRREGVLGEGDQLKGVYGFRMKVGHGGDAVDIEPFGNVKLDKKSRQAVVHEVREPLFDVIEEKDRILVIAEMPGITTDDISVSVDGDVMNVEASRRDRKYSKEILLPKPVLRSRIKVACNNGIVEISCPLK
ncbi:MAG: gas vesicle protein GvpH [Candidatus Binatus sp.]|uniref:gas vesicle protein GvpH n=1 Tax=Candidatus Binatus sp. TaxID=2811406 RepID=UPI00271846E6|nr:gas vesicle protein GvpH [Candidatus Binatus sp.]MDO8433218.1 gas vesicle protein GvpH [Candidatus Binatus sp.]